MKRTTTILLARHGHLKRLLSVDGEHVGRYLFIP